jgi:hypothetical protein
VAGKVIPKELPGSLELSRLVKLRLSVADPHLVLLLRNTGDPSQREKKFCLGHKSYSSSLLDSETVDCFNNILKQKRHTAITIIVFRISDQTPFKVVHVFRYPAQAV